MKHDYKDRKARLLCTSECCEFCGGTYRLQVHHMVKRDELSVRWDVRNLVKLCSECHDHNQERRMWRRFMEIRPVDCLYLLDLFPSNKRWFDELFMVIKDLPDRGIKPGCIVRIADPRSLKSSLAEVIDPAYERCEVALYPDEYVSFVNEVNDAKECSPHESQSRRTA